MHGKERMWSKSGDVWCNLLVLSFYYSGYHGVFVFYFGQLHPFPLLCYQQNFKIASFYKISEFGNVSIAFL